VSGPSLLDGPEGDKLLALEPAVAHLRRLVVRAVGIRAPVFHQEVKALAQLVGDLDRRVTLEIRRLAATPAPTPPPLASPAAPAPSPGGEHP
jgi:hypothetical protein